MLSSSTKDAQSYPGMLQGIGNKNGSQVVWQNLPNNLIKHCKAGLSQDLRYSTFDKSDAETIVEGREFFSKKADPPPTLMIRTPL